MNKFNINPISYLTKYQKVKLIPSVIPPHPPHIDIFAMEGNAAFSENAAYFVIDEWKSYGRCCINGYPWTL